MALEIVRLKVLEARLNDGFNMIGRPVEFVNGQVVLGHEDVPDSKNLVAWLNQIIMAWPSEHSRGELFASALTQIYGEDWTVMAANPMSMAMKHGKSLDYHRDVALIARVGFGHQEY